MAQCTVKKSLHAMPCEAWAHGPGSDHLEAADVLAAWTLHPCRPPACSPKHTLHTSTRSRTCVHAGTGCQALPPNLHMCAAAGALSQPLMPCSMPDMRALCPTTHVPHQPEWLLRVSPLLHLQYSGQHQHRQHRQQHRQARLCVCSCGVSVHPPPALLSFGS